MRGAGCPRVTQPFATLFAPEGALTVRLACVRRAASVHPEPGSNSPFKFREAGASSHLLVRGALPRSVTLNLGFASKLTSLPALRQVHFEFRLVCLRRSEKIAVSDSQGALRRCVRARAARGLTIRTRKGRRDPHDARPQSLHNLDAIHWVSRRTPTEGVRIPTRGRVLW